MSSTSKQNALKQSNATDSLIPFSILPSPFNTVLVISSLQHQQAVQRVAELDQEVKKTGVNFPLNPTVTKEEKNNDTATRNFIAMKYLIQQQFIALPDEQYFLTVDQLQRHKDLLQELEKYEHAVEKLQKSGGYTACSIQFHSKQGSSSHKNLSNEASDTEYSLPPLKSGARTLAKFLSLVEDDSLDDLSNRVGDLLTSTKNNVHQSDILNGNQFSPNTDNEVSKWKGEFALSKTKRQTNHDFVAPKNEFDKKRDKTIITYANDSARSLGGYGRQY
ncbi:4214_t:CDS:2 [Funneliformis caledonium]|uniref:4214_t:CDS:1 n=1 Tax=Funneliformis caledonium TaxID=1117310 RepID=A0A9N8WDI8_9GLOM|nr:4214_t:CDS:2 [Funneliformis caledonium]